MEQSKSLKAANTYVPVQIHVHSFLMFLLLPPLPPFLMEKRPRKCKVINCKKQAQGNFNRMCKSHFREYEGFTPQEQQQKAILGDSRQPAMRTNRRQSSVITDQSSSRQDSADFSIASDGTLCLPAYSNYANALNHKNNDPMQDLDHEGGSNDMRDPNNRFLPYQEGASPSNSNSNVVDDEIAALWFSSMDKAPTMICEEWSNGSLLRKEEKILVDQDAFVRVNVASVALHGPPGSQALARLQARSRHHHL